MSRLIGIPRSITTRLEQAEINLALNTLRDSVDAGWSYLAMAQGIADEFADTTGIGSIGAATYDAPGKYIHNPSTYGVNLCATGQTIYGNQDASYVASRAFDGSDATAALSLLGGSLADCWIGQDFGAGKTIRRIGAKFNLDGGGTTANEGFLSLAIEYSDNGTSWTTHHSVTLAATETEQFIDFSSGGSRRYWRVRATANSAASGTRGRYPDITMHEAVAPPNVQVVSLDHPTGGTPIEARYVLLAEAETGGLNFSDFNFNLSRNAGGNYATPERIDYGTISGGIKIITGIANLSAQGAGTTLRWLLNTFNNRTLRLHGVWLQWRF